MGPRLTLRPQRGKDMKTQGTLITDRLEQHKRCPLIGFAKYAEKRQKNSRLGSFLFPSAYSLFSAVKPGLALSTPGRKFSDVAQIFNLRYNTSSNLPLRALSAFAFFAAL